MQYILKVKCVIQQAQISTGKKIQWRNNDQLRVKCSFLAVSFAESPGLRFPGAEHYLASSTALREESTGSEGSGPCTLQGIGPGGISRLFLCQQVRRLEEFVWVLCSIWDFSRSWVRMKWSLNKQLTSEKPSPGEDELLVPSCLRREKWGGLRHQILPPPLSPKSFSRSLLSLQTHTFSLRTKPKECLVPGGLRFPFVSTRAHNGF